MSKKWSGDGRHKLPANQVEPYRLWFEFLKLAAKDSSVTIDRDFYARWGDFENQDFSTWWSAHWRDLFAIDIGVYELTDLKRKVAKSDQEIIIRIPLSQNIRLSLKQVQDLLKQHNASDRLRDMNEGQFRLTAGKNDQGELIHPSARMLRNLGKLRLLFHVYRFWVANDGIVFRSRVDRTSRAFFKWADAWNIKVSKKKDDKRPKVELPASFRHYVDYLDKRGDRHRVSIHVINDADIPNARRQIVRYITKACRIAENVGRGEFTGNYEN